MNSLFEISPNEAPAVTKDNGRWLVLILLFMTTFGSLFAFDSITVLQSTLEQTLEIDQFKLDLLDDIAIIPNIALPIIAGLIIDRYGIRPTFLLFSILIAVGQLVVYLGVTYTSFYIVLLGRFVFGLGYQSQYVAKCVLVTRWANSTELSFALSLSAFLSRLGTSVSVIASPTLSQDYGLTAPFLLGLILVALQVVLVLAVIYADKKSNVAVDEYRNFNDVVVFRDIWMFAKPFYILASGCALASGIFFSFFQNGSSLLTQQFGMDSSQADTVLNIVFAISAFGLPVFGFIADRVNNKLTIIPWFALIFVIAAFQLAFRQGSEPGNPDFYVLINLIFYGLFYACINATLWSCIPAVAILTKIGIACGFTLSLIEIMMFVLPMLADGIFNATSDSGNGYLSTNVLYASLGVITLGLMVWLTREDKKADDLLSGKSSRPKGGDLSPKKAQVLEMKMEKFMKFENDTMTDL